MSVVLARRLLAQSDTYHPSWHSEVVESRWNRLPIVIFPALLRVDNFASTQVDQFFKDICRARAAPCDACARAQRTCAIHNLSSYRCFDCWVQGWGRCSWEEYMVRCGYANPPTCLPYEAATEYNLTIVPAGLFGVTALCSPSPSSTSQSSQRSSPDDCLEDRFYDELDFHSDSDPEQEGRGDRAPRDQEVVDGVAEEAQNLA